MQKPKRLYVSHVLKFEKIYEKFCCRNFVIFSFHWKYSAKKWCKNISGRSINYSMFQYQTFTSDRNKTLSWSNNEGKTQCTKSMYHHQKSKKKITLYVKQMLKIWWKLFAQLYSILAESKLLYVYFIKANW